MVAFESLRAAQALGSLVPPSLAPSLTGWASLDRVWAPPREPMRLQMVRLWLSVYLLPRPKVNGNGLVGRPPSPSARWACWLLRVATSFLRAESENS